MVIEEIQDRSTQMMLFGWRNIYQPYSADQEIVKYLISSAVFSQL